jgi:bifunctional DNA-binding transcriptional regulator/antitoxin component of YhaV-PrlF toxin-antitoxin module
MNAIVADRGQVTIPKKLRVQLGITPRTVLGFEEENGRLLVTKVAPGDAVSRVLGCVRLDRKTDAILRELRGDA